MAPKARAKAGAKLRLEAAAEAKVVAGRLRAKARAKQAKPSPGSPAAGAGSGGASSASAPRPTASPPVTAPQAEPCSEAPAAGTVTCGSARLWVEGLAGSGLVAARGLAASAGELEAAPAELSAPEAEPPAPAEPAPAATLSAEERGRRLLALPDPWEGVEEREALRRIAEDELDVVVAPPEGEVPGCGVCHLVTKDSGRSELAIAAEAQASVVSLDFSENFLERIDALPALWLRSLAVDGNPLQSLHGIADLFPRLLSLDVSFVDLSSVEDAWQSLASCPRLRSIVAEGCGLVSLEEIPAMPQLTSLELQDNALDEVSELEALARACRGLRRLDLRENGLVSSFAYGKAVRRLFPQLEWHNNQSTKAYVAKAHSQGAFVLKEVHAIDGLYRNEHCSCLEGNPCLDRATCLDWANRQRIAAQACRRKGNPCIDEVACIVRPSNSCKHL